MPQAEEIARPEAGGARLSGGKLKVAVLGATGMVGQQLTTLLKDHPWFEVVIVAASANSARKSYAEAVRDRWAMETRIPDEIATMNVWDVQAVDEIVSQVDVAFCAINLDKEGVLRLEHAYAAGGAWVTSNNSAHRPDPFVPMVIPAVNPHHLDLIPRQRHAKGYRTGALIVKSNCSIQSYVIALEPLREFGIESVSVHSEQAISGAGKTFVTFPDIERNLIPMINGEERKSEVEPLKIWGKVGVDGIVPASGPKIKAKCVRVSVLHGHTAYVTVKFRVTPTVAQILERWENYGSPDQSGSGLPSAPRRLIHYLPEPDRPQPRLDVMTENGMAVSVGQLKVDNDQLVSFTGLSHNLILGAAGGAVLATEAAVARQLVYRRISTCQETPLPAQ
ncbi:MAG TPA: aspartate-semialdehyde dehydrogenase [Pyrinomonadaceae bacterium]|nr:aspartate-semialdehyde dehydrogenase [Pyrinomonadaceae bacterium]